MNELAIGELCLLLRPLAFCDFLRELVLGCSIALAGVGERADDRGNEQADDRPAEKHHPGLRAIDHLLEHRLRSEHDRPVRAGNGNRPAVAEERFRRMGRKRGQATMCQASVIEHEIRFGRLGAVVDLHVESLESARKIAIQDLRNEIAHPERAIHVADQRRASAFGSIGHDTICIDRQVDERTCLHVLARFLHERDFTAERRTARVSCTFHGSAATRLGEHVIADGAAVAPVLGLEIDDRRIDVARAFRIEAIVGAACPSLPLDEAFYLLLPQTLDVADALDARIEIIDAEIADEVAPLLSRHRRHGIRGSRGRTQHLLVGAHGIDQQPLERGCLLVELPARLVRRIGEQEP